jgi:hypothetical protein
MKLDRIEAFTILGLGIAFVLAGLAGVWTLF